MCEMKCIAPSEISDEQLLAYGDGEADQSTLDHIRRCPYCAEQARAIAADQLALRTLFYRAECPDAHTLGEYHLGLLSADERAAIKNHLRTCVDCAAEMADLDHFLQAVSVDPATTPLQRQLKRMVARLTPAYPGLENQQPAPAFRGAAAAPADVYLAEDIKVVVGLEADGLRAGRKMLLGFTVREGNPIESLSGAHVQLSHQGQTVALEQVDTLGNFVISDLTSGEYELLLFTDKEQVVIEAIVV
jgi:hypothetical protein